MSLVCEAKCSVLVRSSATPGLPFDSCLLSVAIRPLKLSLLFFFSRRLSAHMCICVSRSREAAAVVLKHTTWSLFFHTEKKKTDITSCRTVAVFHKLKYCFFFSPLCLMLHADVGAECGVIFCFGIWLSCHQFPLLPTPLLVNYPGLFHK